MFMYYEQYLTDLVVGTLKMFVNRLVRNVTNKQLLCAQKTYKNILIWCATLLPFHYLFLQVYWGGGGVAYKNF